MTQPVRFHRHTFVVTTMLGEQLRGTRCRVYSSDLRVRILATGLATYPDVTVVCGPTERDPASSTHVVNPRVVVEVTSDGTEEYDRGEKREHYEKAPSIEAVVLVSHRERSTEVWTREASTWKVDRHGSGSVAAISRIDCRLSVDAVYDAASERVS